MNNGGVENKSRENLKRFGLIYTVHLLTGDRDVCTVSEFAIKQRQEIAVQGFTDPMWAEAIGLRIRREIEQFERGLS